MEAPTRLSKLLQLVCNCGSSIGLGMRKTAGKQIGQMLSGSEQRDLVMSSLQQLMGALTGRVWEGRMGAAFAIGCILESNSQYFACPQEGDKLPSDILLLMESFLEGCPTLLASGGSEYDVELGKLLLVEEQRKNVKATLGITDGMGMDALAAELVTDADLQEQPPVVVEMSARERAMAKRTARMNSQKGLASTVAVSREECKGESPFACLPLSSGPQLLVSLEQLVVHPSWQARHGAIVGLQALCEHLPINELAYLILAQRVLAVLLLDRFGDYNGEQVVAPVREAAAQLAAMLADKSIDCKKMLLDAAEWMCGRVGPAWQVRHAGLLLLKYLWPLLAHDEIKRGVSMAEKMLGDGDEDSVALAASLLTGIDGFADSARVVELLEELEEASPAIGPLLQLLASLSFSGGDNGPLKNLLLALISSPTVATRRNALKLLLQISSIDDTILRIAFQRLVVGEEEDDEVVELAEKLCAKHLAAFTPSLSNTFLEILLTRLDEPFDPRLFLFFTASGEPAAHQLGFRKADLMLVSPERVLLSRRRAALALCGAIKNCECKVSGDLALMVCAWLGISTQARGSSRAMALYNALSVEPKQRELLMTLLLEEPLSALHQDLAAGLIQVTKLPDDLLLLAQKKNIPALQAFLRVLPNAWEWIGGLETAGATLVERLIVIAPALQNLNAPIEEAWKICSVVLHQGEPVGADAFCALVSHRCCSNAVKSALISSLLGSQFKTSAAYLLHALTSRAMDAVMPWVPLLVLPAVRWMSEKDLLIRNASSQAFANLIRVLPLVRLEAPLPSAGDEDLDQALFAHSEDARHFLRQLAPTPSTKPVQPVKLPIEPTVQLRPYQEEGIAWLMFLRKYGLHGILADDMGLGKTLQTLCCLAADLHDNTKRALVVCPASLMGHWAQEAQVYFPALFKEHQSMVVYAGPDRSKYTAASLSAFKLIITSYDVARNDQSLLQMLGYSYLVLDEGHLLRNPTSKTAAAVRSFMAEHRLLLTGTPIQNAVKEMWALFDVLMPGFLGADESSFMARYGKPILAVQPSATATAANAEASYEEAEKAMQALHRQVLPFVLRRMKTDVLKDLPPKIIQDRMVEPSRLQLQLLDHLSRTQDDLVEPSGEDKMGGKMHVFQSLQYLRRLCVHPSLVLTPEHPLYQANKHMDNLADAPKLAMLREILVECDIIREDPSDSASSFGHRVLVFAQQKSTLDLVDKLVLRPAALPFLRIDGGTEARQRQSIATQFNLDASIPILLLTTRVGGLGLNLTGADTVIFLEHDWNPQADMQAMDRAHRLGQTRAVTVYRLILRESLEERIMGLQAWKKRMAGTIVSQQNAQADTGDILDLLEGATSEANEGSKRRKKEAGASNVESQPGMPKWLAEATAAGGEMDAGEEYKEEFDLEAFVRRLNRDSVAGA